MTTLKVLFCSELHVSQQQYKGKALLHFHSNNGYVNASQYYYIDTLPILLGGSLSSPICPSGKQHLDEDKYGAVVE
jgi:hypothetical protein